MLTNSDGFSMHVYKSWNLLPEHISKKNVLFIQLFQCSTRPDVFHKKNVKQTASAWIWIPPIAKFGEKSALELKTIL